MTPWGRCPLCHTGRMCWLITERSSPHMVSKSGKGPWRTVQQLCFHLPPGCFGFSMQSFIFPGLGLHRCSGVSLVAASRGCPSWPCVGSGAQAQLRHMASSQTRDWTRVPSIGRWILYHWATREALVVIFLNFIIEICGLCFAISWILAGYKLLLLQLFHDPQDEHLFLQLLLTESLEPFCRSALQWGLAHFCVFQGTFLPWFGLAWIYLNLLWN